MLMPARTMALFLAPCLVCALLPPSAFAQSTAAQITGVATDESGAVVPQLAVQVVELATGVVSKAQTNEAGVFRFLSLAPGTYRLEAEGAGFRKFVQEPILLQVADRVAIDIKMSLGQVSESVTVSAGARLIETETGELNQLVNERTIRDLPLGKREAIEFVLLAPGFQGSRRFERGGLGDGSPNYFANDFRVGGSRGLTNEVLIDGVPNTGGDRGFMQYSPSVDTTQEFRIQATPFSAEYGRTSGPVINVITKSGTNEFHGVLYEFHRNSVLDANEFFANMAGRPKRSHRRNQFGGTAGGAIIKNRLFYFGDYDGQRLGSPETRLSTVPTLLQRRGDFSETFDRSGNLVRIFDPQSRGAGPDGGQFRLQFPGNQIPSSQWDPISVKATEFYPQPNTGGDRITGVNNYINTKPRTQSWNRWGTRLDYYITDSNRLFGRYAEQRSVSLTTGRWDGVSSGERDTEDWFRSVALTDTHTFSPTLTGELKVGYGGSGALYRNIDEGFDITSVGFPSALRDVTMPFFPRFVLSDVAQLGGATFNNFSRHTFTLQGTISKVIGRHLIKLGGDARWLQSNPRFIGRPSGSFEFDRGMTQGPDPNRATSAAGHGFASFLLGYGSTGYVDHRQLPAFQRRYNAGFLQWDWRVGRKLTLNLGVRYILEIGPTERFNRLTSINLTATSPVPGSAFPNPPGVLEYRSDEDRNLFATDRNNFEPRFGFAYQPTEKTVLRGGYGIFYVPAWSMDTIGQAGFNTQTPWVTSIDNGITPLNRLSAAFPQGFNLPTGARDPRALFGFALEGFLRNEPVAYMQQWNYSLQRELPSGTVVEVAYWGSKGTKLQFPRYQMNQLPNRYLALGNALNQQVPNPFVGLVTSGPLSQPTVARRQTLLPYPQYTSVLRTWAMAASSIYHALTIRAEKRVSRGLAFAANYTAGKLIDDASAQQPEWGRDSGPYDMENLRKERAVSAWDSSQRLVFNVVYDLPWGRGRSLKTNMHPILEAVIGGWSAGILGQFQTGVPVAVSRNAVNDGRSANLDHPTIDRWFDTQVFRPADPFTYGNVGRFLPDVRTDGLKTLDVSALKDFLIRERIRIQFRAEFFNLTNTPRFGDPDGNVTSLQFGKVRATANSPRQVQLGLKLYW